MSTKIVLQLSPDDELHQLLRDAEPATKVAKLDPHPMRRRTDRLPNELTFVETDASLTGVQPYCDRQIDATSEHVVLEGDTVSTVRPSAKDLDRVVAHELATRADRDDGLNAARGIVYGLILSVPLWVAIYLAVRWLS